MSRFILTLSVALLLACSDNVIDSSPEVLLTRMEAIDSEITALISTSCSTSDQCMATPIGSKACGGPSRYIVHSSNMDLEKLNELVTEFTQLNEEYNTKTGAISDCALVVKPEVACVDGNCQPASN